MRLKVSSLRRMQYDSLAAVITAAFLTALVLLNILVHMAAQRMPLFVDLTRNQAYKLSEQSIAFLDSVKSPVSIIVLVDEKVLESAGGYYLQAKEILDQYPKFSSKIQVEYLDIIVNPWFAAQYPDMNLKEYDILVCCGDECVRTSLSSLFTVVSSQSMKEQYIQSSCAEQEITSAIMRVTSDKKEKIILLTGQDEFYSEALKDLLSNAGYLTEERNLLTDELDIEAQLVILFAPQRDLEVDMIKKLDAYLINEGNYGRNLIYAPHPTADKMPNLETYMEQWGIKMGSSIVMESNPSKYMNNLPYVCLVDYTEDDYVGKLTTNTSFMSYMGKDISTAFEARSAYITEVLMSYGEGAYAVSVRGEKVQESEGNLAALIKSTYTKYNGMAKQQSSVFAFASAASFDTKVLDNGSASNRQYFTALVDDLTGKESFITVTPVELENPSLDITQSEYYQYSVLFVGILPVSVLAIGLFVWLRRCHR